MRLEEIIYEDHWQDESGWVDDHESELEPLACRSVGYVVAEDDRVVRLCANLDFNDRGFGSFTILKRCITSREVLRG